MIKLEQLLSVLKSGNYALERKLQNLLAEDIQLVEYTDDSALFIKDNYLVLAKFKHSLNENAISSDDIIDNEIIYISKNDLEVSLKEDLERIISAVSTEDLLTSKELTEAFCEKFYQYSVLKNVYPFVFTESLAPKAKGYKLRKKGFDLVSKFKGAVFSMTAVNESADDISVVHMAELLEAYGSVLSLGKDKVKTFVLDAVFNNDTLAESITKSLFEMINELPDSNKDIEDASKQGYDFEQGHFPDEDYTADEEYTSPEEEEHETPEEETEEFAPFDPAKLTPEESHQLHVDTLKSILDTIYNFVIEKSNSQEETTISPDTDKTIKDDIDKLADEAISDEDLASIEGRWMPVLDYFLSSDVHKTESEEFELPIDSQISPEGEEHNVDELGGTGEETGEALGTEPNALPQEPNTEENKGF